MIAIMLRELRAYFWSPIGYIFMGFFLLLTGFFFALNSVIPGNPRFQVVLSQIVVIFLFLVPILTMRLVAEEKKQRTDQLLLTVPVSVFGVVLGKYLAAVGVFIASLLITVLYPISLSFFGSIPVWEIIGGYIGFFLLGSTFIAIGLLMSSLTENVVIAAITTFGVLLLMFGIGWAQSAVPAGNASGLIFAGILGSLLLLWVYLATRNIFLLIGSFLLLTSLIIIVQFGVDGFYETFVMDFLAWFSLTQRFDIFFRGVLSLSSVVYFISFSVLMLFFTARVIERKRWN